MPAPGDYNEPTPPSRRRWRLIASTVAVVLAALVGSAIARGFIWPPEDNIATADAVVVFAGGHQGDRLDHALGLIDQGVAPTLVISLGSGEWDRGPAMERLCTDGADDVAIICLVAEPDSTKGEAAAFADIAAERSWSNVVAVTSDWHLHRSQLWLQRCYPVDVSRSGAATALTAATLFHEVAGTLHAELVDRDCLATANYSVTLNTESGPLPDAPRDPERPIHGRTGTNCQSWSNDRFLMSLYSVPVEHPGTLTVDELVDDGYTHLGPWYNDDRWSSGERAAELELCTIFPVGRALNVNAAIAEADVAVAALEADMRRALADPELNASISMWSVMPEEFNIYQPGHEELLRRLVETARSLDPLQRPIYSYLGSSADPVQFETHARLTNVVGQGNYMSSNGLHDQRGSLIASIRRGQSALRATGELDDFVLPVVEHRIHNGELDPQLAPMVETWVRHDLFTVAAGGANGFISFSGFPPKQGQDVFDRYNQAYTTVLAELNDIGFQSFYRAGNSTEPSLTTLSGPSTVDVRTLFLVDGELRTESYPSVTARSWTQGTKRLTIAVNHSNDPVEVRIDLSGDDAMVVSIGALGVAIIQDP